MHINLSSWLPGMLVLTILSGCRENRPPEALLVDVVEAEYAVAGRHAEYPGLTEAKENANLSFKLIGTIKKIFVSEGDYVTRGQVLASIDSRDYATQLEATESEYRQIKAECERVMAMHDEHAVSDNDYDKARSGLERISAKLKNHRNQLEDCQLRAPYAGYVNQIFRSAGETVAPGLPVVGLFTSGGSEVVINVPDTEYRQRGSAVSYEATFASLPGRTFPLKLKGVARKSNGNRLYQMRFVLKHDTRDVVPGMSAMVRIRHNSGNSDNRILVPVGSLFSKDGRSFVFVYDKDSSFVRKSFVEVESLRTDGKAVIIGGLDAGQLIVASGVGKLTDRRRVKPLSLPSEDNYGKLL